MTRLYSALFFSFLLWNNPLLSARAEFDKNDPSCHLIFAAQKALDPQFSITDLRLEGIDLPALGPGTEPTYISVFYKTELAARVRFNLDQDNLKFDIRIEPKFQGIKLYGYLLQQVLKRHPEVKSVPSRMTIVRSDEEWISESARIFFHALLSPAASDQDYRNLLRTDFLPQLENDARRAFRQRVIHSLRQMPAVKIRAHNGFGDVTRIILSAESRLSFTFDATQGQFAEARARVLVWITDAGPFEILANGELARVARTEIEFPHYESMMEYPGAPGWRPLGNAP